MLIPQTRGGMPQGGRNGRSVAGASKGVFQ